MQKEPDISAAPFSVAENDAQDLRVAHRNTSDVSNCPFLILCAK